MLNYWMRINTWWAQSSSPYFNKEIKIPRDDDEDKLKDDQAPRGEGLEDGSTIKLTSKQDNLINDFPYFNHW